MISFRTTNLFSVQALLRTATLTVLGAGALLVTPAQAGIIYQTNFSSITTSGSPVVSGRATELITSGSLFFEGNYTLPTGWSQVSGNTYAYQYTPNASGNGNGTPLDTASGTNYGVLLNTTCGVSGSFGCTGGNVGSIQFAMSGLTLGTSYTVTVDYWGTTQGAGTFNTGSNNLGLSIGVNGIGSATSSSTIANATNGTFVTGTYTFIANGATGTLVLADVTGSPNNPPAAIVGDVTIATAPEPASALFLIGPAAAFFAYRRRAAKK